MQWTLMTQLEDLTFADAVAFLSRNHRDMQSKLTRMAKISAKAGLRISKSKTKGMRINTTNADRLELDGETSTKWRTWRTKLQIFNTNVKSVLLYGSETWRVTKQPPTNCSPLSTDAHGLSRAYTDLGS